MKSPQEFSQFIDETLQSDIDIVEQKRTEGLDARAKKALPIQFIAYAGVGVVVLLVIMRSLLSANVPKPILLIVFAFIGFGAYSVYKNKDKVLNMAMNSAAGNALSGGAIDEFKEKVVRPMIAFIDNSFSYEPRSEISMDELMTSDMLEGSGYSQTGNDLVTGVINNIPFKFCDLEVEKTGFDTLSQRTLVKEVIKGSYFVADFELTFASPVYVMANKPTTKNELHYAFKLHGHNIQLEDVDFNKQFNLFSDDQVEARYIFTPTMMEYVKELNKALGGNLYMAFVGNKLHIINNSGVDNFEIEWASAMNTKESLQKYFGQLTNQTNIVSDLKLNSKIWKS